MRDLCRQHGISDHTYYRWRSKFGGMEVPEAKRLKALEEKNRQLKQLLAEKELDNLGLRTGRFRRRFILLTKATANPGFTSFQEAG